jgi:RiboL-PSP-HEPN
MNITTTPTSRAAGMFTQAIKDAENLLAHFNILNTLPPPPDIEVLKRAGLIMAMTAWETYVEDRVNEAVATRLAAVTDNTISEFIRNRLDEEIKRLHNPNAEKTLQLFRDYAGVDLANSWAWNNFGPQLVRDRLNDYLKLRGDIVHRARVVEAGPPRAQPVTKEGLQKAITFLKNLVAATEAALVSKAE